MATTLDVALPAPDLLAALKDVVGYFDGKADQLQKTMCEATPAAMHVDSPSDGDLVCR